MDLKTDNQRLACGLTSTNSTPVGSGCVGAGTPPKRSDIVGSVTNNVSAEAYVRAIRSPTWWSIGAFRSDTRRVHTTPCILLYGLRSLLTLPYTQLCKPSRQSSERILALAAKYGDDEILLRKLDSQSHCMHYGASLS